MNSKRETMPPKNQNIFLGISGMSVWFGTLILTIMDKLSPILSFVSLVIGIIVAILTGYSVVQSIKIKRLKIEKETQEKHHDKIYKGHHSHDRGNNNRPHHD